MLQFASICIAVALIGYQYEPFRMCTSIVDSSTCQWGFGDHSVVISINKIQVLSFFSFSQID